MVSVNALKYLCLLFIGFLFFYAFNLPIIGNSAYLAVLIIGFLLSINNAAFNRFLSVTSSPAFKLGALSYVAFIILAVFSTSLNQQFDFTILPTLLNNLICLFAVAGLASLFFDATDKKLLAYRVPSHLLMIQAIIIIVMLLVPPVRELIQDVIRTDHEMQRLDIYGGVRGLGIAGSAAFGLAVGLGLMGFVLQRYFMLSSRTPSIVAFSAFGISLLAALTAGRTAILGFMAGFVLYCFYKTDQAIGKKLIKHSLYSLAVAVLLVIYVLSNPALQELITSYWTYALKFFIAFITEGGTGNSSLNTLESMYFYPELNNLFFGDGIYTGLDGSYYLHTDPGYMRFLLLMGPLGSAIIYLLFCCLTLVAAKSCETKEQSHGIFFLGILLIAFIFHYKGEVVFLNVIFMKVYFFIALSLWLYKNNAEQIEHSNE